MTFNIPSMVTCDKIHLLYAHSSCLTWKYTCVSQRLAVSWWLSAAHAHYEAALSHGLSYYGHWSFCEEGSWQQEVTKPSGKYYPLPLTSQRWQFALASLLASCVGSTMCKEVKSCAQVIRSSDFQEHINVCMCVHVYVVYEDTNLYNDMGIT